MAQPIWETPAGLLGSYSSTLPFNVPVRALPVNPALLLSYNLLNGVLPNGFRINTVNNNCVISGIPEGVNKNTTYTFTIRVNDELGNFADRTFSIELLTAGFPKFVISSGNLLTVFDSEFLSYELEYTTPIANDQVKFFVASGDLPEGLFLDEDTGIISGYPVAPINFNGSPSSKKSDFTITLSSVLGSASAAYSITVKNVQLVNPTVSPRKPVILNYFPRRIPIEETDPFYEYYLIGQNEIPLLKSGDFFSYKIIGYDFDGGTLQYFFANLPPGLTGDPNSGWITGTININTGLSQYIFEVSVTKPNGLYSETFQFVITVSNDVTNDIVWETPSYLGTINNNTVSTLKIEATSDQNLTYRLIDGDLPSQLTLDSAGELIGQVSYQPTKELLDQFTTTTFTFTVEAIALAYPLVKSKRTFTLDVYQLYNLVTENVYMKASPNLSQRSIVDTLLTDTSLIPTEFLYRANDYNFGKATDISFVHAYGIDASSAESYIEAMKKNHYWRTLTLGELKTAIARDENGDIVYEVVYSQIVDDLINEKGQSVSSEIKWPTRVSLELGPYLTSEDFLYTSFSNVQNNLFYTSLTPGSTNTFYPASLDNMATQLSNVLGNDPNSGLLPKWMTTQQANGNVLGYTRAWVICYTISGKSTDILNNINNNWPYKLNSIDFTVDRYYIDKSNTYNWNDNLSIPSWSELPSATPTPNPINSKDFVISFPQKTITP
jgi:hypothetical protein